MSVDNQNWIHSILVDSCSITSSKESFVAASAFLGAKSFPELHFGGGCADPELVSPT